MDVSGALFWSEEGRGRLGRKSAARDAWRAGGGELGCEFGEDLQDAKGHDFVENC